MASITSLKSIVSYMTKACAANSDEVGFNLLKKLTSGYGTDLSPIVYKGKNLDELPDIIKAMLSGLKKPTVTVNGRSRVKGQGIFGFKIQDGNKTISTAALGLDLTIGDPVLQLRGTYGNGTQQAIRFNTIFDTNKTGASALKGDIFVDKKLAKELGISDDIIEDITTKKPSAKAIKEGAKDFREFVALEGHEIRSIDRCLDELTQIASKTDEVTEESAKEAFDLITTAMGQKGKVKLNFWSKAEAKALGEFDPLTGKINLDLNSLKDHQDLAIIMAHELTHMEDFVMLYKFLGAEEFKSIIGKLYDNDNINLKWYDEMSKYITKKHFAFQNKGKVTKIITFNGIEITDPNSIKEYLASKPRTKLFDIDSMIKEIKVKTRITKKKLDNEYGYFKSEVIYINSDCEKHARETELQLLEELENKGIFRETTRSKRYGQAPGEYPEDLSRIFRSIEAKLGRNKNKEFNELYSQSLYVIDLELGDLHTAIKKATTDAERDALEFEYYKIIGERYSSIEKFDFKVLNIMRRKVGIRMPIDTSAKIYREALKKVDTTLYDLYEQKCRGGLSDKEFYALIQKEKELIKERFGDVLTYRKKFNEEIRNIKR